MMQREDQHFPLCQPISINLDIEELESKYENIMSMHLSNL